MCVLRLTVYIFLQIATFCRTNISYDGRSAYGIILPKLPNLNPIAKQIFRDFLKEKVFPSRGLLNNPRPFLPDSMSALKQVDNLYTVSACYTSTYVFETMQVPSSCKFKSKKCAVIVASSFSDNIQRRFQEGKYTVFSLSVKFT